MRLRLRFALAHALFNASHQIGTVFDSASGNRFTALRVASTIIPPLPAAHAIATPASRLLWPQPFLLGYSSAVYCESRINTSAPAMSATTSAPGSSGAHSWSGT